MAQQQGARAAVPGRHQGADAAEQGQSEPRPQRPPGPQQRRGGGGRRSDNFTNSFSVSDSILCPWRYKVPPFEFSLNSI